MSKSKTKNAAGNAETSTSRPASTKSGSQESQLTVFDRAMKLFHKRDFAGALPLFEEAGTGKEQSVAHTAQLHARMCRQRMEQAAPELVTAEDNYAFGVALASRRDFDRAEGYLNRALQLSPGADHILYSLALVKGMQGDIPAAASFLTRAVEIQPANRSAVRTDPDFHDLLSHPAIREVVS